MKLSFPKLNCPILLISDAPDHLTGLARIGRDLASFLCTLPQFRVGYLGLDGVGSRRFPWVQYSFPSYAGFGDAHIEEVWRDFSRGENGIIMSLWDVSRMGWFARPDLCPEMKPSLKSFLGESRTFEKWGYFPVDSTGPDGSRLPLSMAAATAGYDRVLTASEWGRDVVERSIGRETDWIPHGIWTRTFHPIESAKQMLGWPDERVTVGCNMTNQARKDWPVAFETIAILRGVYGDRLHFWAHTDALTRYWNLVSLAADYGVADVTEITMDLTDEQLALRYSACDVTILPSAGEGFGYPIVESLACGTACAVTGYGAGPELVDSSCWVQPDAYRVDSVHNVQRAVISGRVFADQAQYQIDKKREDWDYRSHALAEIVAHLDWNLLKNVWSKWFLSGLEAGR
jgi:glycosyltransferase involved in cell wall biosynthesis